VTDKETAAVRVAADAHRLPFLGIPGISDGLPVFPFDVFCQQIAAHNAARVPACEGGFAKTLFIGLLGTYC
jgi:nucleoside phosphorylase